jgi:hypothetical protein
MQHWSFIYVSISRHSRWENNTFFEMHFTLSSFLWILEKIEAGRIKCKERSSFHQNDWCWNWKDLKHLVTLKLLHSLELSLVNAIRYVMHTEPCSDKISLHKKTSSAEVTIAFLINNQPKRIITSLITLDFDETIKAALFEFIVNIHGCLSHNFNDQNFLM